MKDIIESDVIAGKIHVIRGQKVMLDRDLADLYEVETRVLNQAVSRNITRFPADFMFQLDDTEFKCLISQFVISNRGGTRKLPYAFTEQGVAMLSTVLKSERAIQVNIQIMRAFTMLRQMIFSHDELREKIEAMEKKYDGQFRIVFEAIKELLDIKSKPKKKIGFK
ncbi:MAG TPA: ORF6N domain-containing protein [Spirochaetota bacterium]|nr:ORF6N domain-containing protein [Spirochaetota bacterium]